MGKDKIIDIWQDGEWIEYTHEEFFEYFNFVKKPNLDYIYQVFINGSGSDRWVRIVPKEEFASKTGGELIYNNVHGTYVEILD